MRIGLISDFEGCAASLEAALRYLRAVGVDLIVHAGDILEAPISRDPPVDTFDQLRAADAVVIPGNHDRWLIDYDTPRWASTLWLRRRRRDPMGHWTHLVAVGRAAIEPTDLAWLRSLPEECPLDVPGEDGTIYLCHGMPGNPFNTMWPADPLVDGNVGADDCRAALATEGMARAELVLCGHLPEPLEYRAARADGAPLRVIRSGGRRTDGPRYVAGCTVITRGSGAGPDRWRVGHEWVNYTPRDPGRLMRGR